MTRSINNEKNTRVHTVLPQRDIDLIDAVVKYAGKCNGAPKYRNRSDFVRSAVHALMCEETKDVEINHPDLNKALQKWAKNLKEEIGMPIEVN